MCEELTDVMGEILAAGTADSGGKESMALLLWQDAQFPLVQATVPEAH